MQVITSNKTMYDDYKMHYANTYYFPLSFHCLLNYYYIILIILHCLYNLMYLNFSHALRKN